MASATWLFGDATGQILVHEGLRLVKHRLADIGTGDIETPDGTVKGNLMAHVAGAHHTNIFDIVDFIGMSHHLVSKGFSFLPGDHILNDLNGFGGGAGLAFDGAAGVSSEFVGVSSILEDFMDGGL